MVYSNDKFDILFDGVNINVSVQIEDSYHTTIQFNYMTKRYTFFITEWGGQYISDVRNSFMEYYKGIDNRDETRSIILQMSRDIFKTLEKILISYRRCIYGYALWYKGLSSMRHKKTYVQRITLITCNCIVRYSFTSPVVQWDLVEFDSLSQ